MSASEKLKTLEEATPLSVLPKPFNVIGNYGQWASLAEPYLALRFVLPQIVAVVEVAERMPTKPDPDCEGCRNARSMTGVECMWHGKTAVGPLVAALAALDEALT